MKSIITAFAALVVATSSFAQVVGFTKYDYDRAVNNGGNVQELAVGVAAPTPFGVIDAAAIAGRSSFGLVDRNAGWEVGYSNGLGLSYGKLTGRVALGQRNDVAGGNYRYYSLGAEFSAPLTDKLDAFVGYRHRNVTSANSIENRYTAGVDYKVTKSLTARVGYAATQRDGVTFNGVTTAVSYAF